MDLFFCITLPLIALSLSVSITIGELTFTMKDILKELKNINRGKKK